MGPMQTMATPFTGMLSCGSTEGHDSMAMSNALRLSSALALAQAASRATKHMASNAYGGCVPSEEAEEKAEEPNEADRVRILREVDSGCQGSVGEVGTIVEVDSSDERPYKVKFADDRTGWYKAASVTKADAPTVSIAVSRRKGLQNKKFQKADDAAPKSDAAPDANAATTAPGKSDADRAPEESAEPAPADESSRGRPNEASAPRKTSIVLRNLPDGFTRTKLMYLLIAQHLFAHVDLLYVPGDLKHKRSYGYAVVNLTAPEAANEFMATIQGFSDWGVPSAKACEAFWCSDFQGLDAHIERYRDSRIMHVSVWDEYKPAIFKGGRRIPFPPGSKRLAPPRLRKNDKINDRINSVSVCSNLQQ